MNSEEDPYKKEYFKNEVESFRVENVSGFIKEGGKAPLKFRDMEIRGFGLEPISWTEKGAPQADANVIRELAGQEPVNGKFGKAYDQMCERGREEDGEKMSIALDHWLKFKHIEKLLSTYIKPLQGQIDKNGRIHTSMNLNTETGRISCKKPNLQNQPALDKDKY